MAGPTRFELATSGVTGRRSNQLNYGPKYFSLNLSLNLSTNFSLASLWRHYLVGGTGIEPVTPGL